MVQQKPDLTGVTEEIKRCREKNEEAERQERRRRTFYCREGRAAINCVDFLFLSFYFYAHLPTKKIPLNHCLLHS